jgi:hypothetical protein
MPADTWSYANSTLNLFLNKIPNSLPKESIATEGDQKKGKCTFKSTKTVDEIWGSEAKVEVSWEQIDPTQYHHGLKVKDTIRSFSAIEVVATKKETYWHLSHEMTYWLGNRQQLLRKRHYPSNIIHAIMFCELSQRLFEVHAVVYSNFYAKYEKILLEMIFSLQCHN